MALPKLETPTFELILPSTKEVVKFRPFLVKEHKILLQQQNTVADNIVKTIKELIHVCTYEKLDLDKLPNFDMEYIFLMLRAKSIGELVDITVKCDCNKKLNAVVNLNNVKVINDENLQNTNLKIKDNLFIKVRHPVFTEMMAIYEHADTDKVFEVVGKCIDSVTMDDKLYDNFSNEELNEFILGLTKKEFEIIEQFFLDMPKVVYEDEIKCKDEECGVTNVIKLQGIEHFFI